jgi:hypothetical protein
VNVRNFDDEVRSITWSVKFQRPRLAGVVEDLEFKTLA